MKIIILLFVFIGVSCCSKHKEKTPIKTNIKSEITNDIIDTLKHENIIIHPFIPLENFNYLLVDVTNKSTESFPLKEFCIQVKEQNDWKTLFCDTIETTIVPPQQTKRVKIDLHLNDFQYHSDSLYQFIAFYRKNKSVYKASQTYYSLTLFKKGGKVYMLPDHIRED
jgi:hypothetical protein